jgi:hypothetical protein
LLSGERAGLTTLPHGLVEARLLTRSGTEHGQRTPEVAHQALPGLPPLSDWLADDRSLRLSGFSNLSDVQRVPSRASRAGAFCPSVRPEEPTHDSATRFE